MQTWVNSETGETGFSLDSYARDRSVEFEDNHVGEAENKTWFELAFAVRACLFDHVFDSDLCTEKVFFWGGEDSIRMARLGIVSVQRL